jgi:hypothetical protein
MPKVLNLSIDSIPYNSVYIGRPTKWGNPHIIGIHGNRKEVIKRFKSSKKKDKVFIAMVKKELRGKNLVCHCKPEDCHGDWLLEIANE